MPLALFAKPFATGQITIDAAPDEAYRLISDPPAMALLGEEIVRVRWLDRAAVPAVGARFRGYNRNGPRRWATDCRITDADPGRRFAYDVATPFRLPISRWEYDIVPDGDGCVVTETNWLRAPLWFLPFAVLITGVLNRPGANTEHIAVTLRRLKDRLEEGVSRSG
ncbi:SRPBCC family protein [Spirillospora sp. NPDC047279]|uniref:SRPBCC family protein n=1 Tax=Spirillospora sp. NPDC047279 TaxID=3155478 RepID=UPI0034110BD7